MKRKLRKPFSYSPQHSRILDDYTVQPRLIERSQELIQPILDLILFQQRIHCKLKLSPVKMAVINSLNQQILIRILRVSPGAEKKTAHIDSIRPCVYRGRQALIRPGWSQQLCHIPSSLSN